MEVTNVLPQINSLEQKALSLQKFHSAEELKNVAEDFEAIFIQKLLSTMQEGLGKNDMLHSQEEGMWRSLLNEEYAKSFSSAGGIGLADMLYEYLAPMVLQGENSIAQKKALQNYANAQQGLPLP